MSESIGTTTKKWFDAVAQGLVATVLFALLPAAGVTYLEHVRSVWATPLLLGLFAALLVFGILTALRLLRTLPREAIVPDVNNIEQCARTWLDTFRFSVQKVPVPNCYFRFLVTTAAGTPVVIARQRDEFTNYVVFRCDVQLSDEEVATISALKIHDQRLLIYKLQLELAHAHVGYSNLQLPLGPFFVVKRLPISPSLTEHDFVSTIDELELTMRCVQIVFQLAFERTGRDADTDSEGDHS